MQRSLAAACQRIGKRWRSLGGGPAGVAPSRATGVSWRKMDGRHSCGGSIADEEGATAARSRVRPLAVWLYPRLIDPVLRPLRPRIVAQCRRLGAGSVLDIASATGAQCRALAAAGFDATGVDLSSGMVRAARRRGGGAEYACASALALPFDNGSFDVALLVLALHEHPEQERLRMLAEAVRVASAHVIIADYQRPSAAWCHLPWQVIRFVEALAGGGHHDGFVEFTRRDGLRGLLRRWGGEASCEVSSHFGTIAVACVELAGRVPERVQLSPSRMGPSSSPPLL